MLDNICFHSLYTCPSFKSPETDKLRLQKQTDEIKHYYSQAVDTSRLSHSLDFWAAAAEGSVHCCWLVKCCMWKSISDRAQVPPAPQAKHECSAEHTQAQALARHLGRDGCTQTSRSSASRRSCSAILGEDSRLLQHLIVRLGKICYWVLNSLLLLWMYTLASLRSYKEKDVF